jgi:hypothetical protein
MLLVFIAGIKGSIAVSLKTCGTGIRINAANYAFFTTEFQFRLVNYRSPNTGMVWIYLTVTTINAFLRY